MNNFAKLIAECQRINPPSETTFYPERIHSVTKEGLDLAPDWRGKDVLILGCGDGYEVEYARKTLGWNAYGLTFLKVEKEAKFNGKEQWRQPVDGVILGDMHDMPIPNGHFHAVYSKETLEHSPCPYLVLCEINRVLKPGGEFFHLIPDGWEKQRDWYHFAAMPPWLWVDLMRKAYLKVEEIKCIPDVEHCTMGNVSYFGRKLFDRVLLEEPVEQYKARLNMGGEYRTVEGLK